MILKKLAKGLRVVLLIDKGGTGLNQSHIPSES